MKLLDTFSLAWIDLKAFRWNGLGVSIVAVATFSAISAFTVFGFGTAFGRNEVELLRIKDDPLSSCIWVGSAIKTRNMISTQKVEELRSAFRSIPEATVVPLRILSDIQPTHPTKDEHPSVFGMTFNNKDPILDGFGFSIDSSQSGVILTPMLLNLLDLKKDTVPPKLEFVFGIEQKTFDILGVTKDDLPDNIAFLIDAKAEMIFRNQKAIRLTDFVTGVTPESWPRLSHQYPQPARDLAKEYGMTFGIDEKAMRVRVAQEMTVAEFRIAIAKFATEMAKFDLSYAVTSEFVDDAREFTEDAADSTHEDTTEDTEQAWDIVAIYFQGRGYELLKRSMPMLEADPLLGEFVNQRVYKQLLKAESEQAGTLRMLTVFEGIFSFAGVLSLFSMLLIRALQKNVEAGILRVLGMSRWRLLTISIIQSLILSSTGCIIGIYIGKQFGHWYAIKQYPEVAYQQIGFLLAPVHYLCLVACILLAGIVGSVIAVIPWQLSSPSELLKGG